jgi:putative pre-16S rRNA nuclease
VVAVDPGTKRVGLAVSDPGGVIAQPVGAEPGEPAATLADRLTARIRELEASELVVGLPRRMDGALGPEAEAARQLAQRLRERTGLRVTMVDERLTSVAAERALIAGGERRAARRQKSDQVAAALILQTYLARRRGRGTPS